MRNWCESNPESSFQATPDSPILGLVQDSAGAGAQGVGTSAEVEKSAPASTTDGGASPTSTAAGETGGSGSDGSRIIPF